MAPSSWSSPLLLSVAVLRLVSARALTQLVGALLWTALVWFARQVSVRCVCVCAILRLALAVCPSLVVARWLLIVLVLLLVVVFSAAGQEKFSLADLRCVCEFCPFAASST